MEAIHNKVQREGEREREREKGNLMLVCCPWQRSKGEFVTGSLL
jgi:hypothetical protein